MPTTTLPVWLLKNSNQVAILRQVATPVDLAIIPSTGLQQLIDDMVATMYRANGIGLAAPQIGRSDKLAVIAPEVDPSLTEPLVLINPVVTPLGDEPATLEEGCLSIPKVFGSVQRAARVKLQAINRRGRPYALEGAGLLARVIQHEVDHLNGKLFIDRTDAITSGKKYLP